MSKIITLTPRTMSPDAAASWRRDRRLSIFCDLAANPGEMPALPADIAEVLPALIHHEQQRSLPAHEDKLIPALTAALAQVGGIRQEDKTPWMLAAFEMFEQLPADLVLAGLIEARKRVTRVGDIVPAVIAFAEKPAASRKRFLDSLKRLAIAAEVHA